MSYQVSRNDEQQMVEVCYVDSVSVEQRKSAFAETLVILGQTDFRRIVIDFDQARLAADPMSAISGFATQVATNALLRQCRIAFVGRSQNTFNVPVETLSAARGYGFRRFYDRETAIAWLMA